jgi:hypothetical protein
LWQAVEESIISKFRYLEGEEAKAVLRLCRASKFLPSRTRQQLALPSHPSQ